MNFKILSVQVKSGMTLTRPAILNNTHSTLQSHHHHYHQTKMQRLWLEMKKNWRIEAMCITACETGELLTQTAGFYAGLSHYNELGLIAGILSGFSFAFYTATRHTPELNKKNISHILKQTLTAEWACVISATTVQYFMGKYGSTFNPSPFEGHNLLLRLIGLPIAFGIGTVAMSLLTLRNPHLSCACQKKDEVVEIN